MKNPLCVRKTSTNKDKRHTDREKIFTVNKSPLKCPLCIKDKKEINQREKQEKDTLSPATWCLSSPINM